MGSRGAGLEKSGKQNKLAKRSSIQLLKILSSFTTSNLFMHTPHT